MAIVESTIGGGNIFSNVLGVNIKDAAAKLTAPLIWLKKAAWTNKDPLEVYVAADGKGTPVAHPVLVEVAADGAFKNILASATSYGPCINLGQMKATSVYIRARYAGAA